MDRLNDCLQGSARDWLTKGRTALTIKNKEKCADVTNFRPITCLPVMWKLLTGIIAEEMYEHLQRKHLLPNELKGCRKNVRGTKDQLLTDKMILSNCKRLQTGLAMEWIDCKKAYYILPHSWIR